MPIPFLQVIKNFAGSEKAVAGGVLVAIATWFMIRGDVSIEQWMEYTEILFATYVAGKTAQGVASAMTKHKKTVPPPPPVD